MDNTEGASGATAAAPHNFGPKEQRSGSDWFGLAVLALLVIFVGGLTGLFGPLFAIACDSCQDGVQPPSTGLAILPFTIGLVPLVTVGSVIGLFLPRGGARAGGFGLVALVVLFIVMQVLGSFPV